MTCAASLETRAVQLRSSSLAAGAPRAVRSRCPSRCVPALACVLAPAGAVTAGARSCLPPLGGGNDERAGRGSFRHAERCRPEERSGGGLPQWRMAGRSPGRQTASESRSGGVVTPVITRPGVWALGKGASERSEQRAPCGVAAPTSESPEPPRSPRLPAHLRAPVGHRFYAWHACVQPNNRQSAQAEQRWDARRHSGISISPGQEMPPRYPSRAIGGTGPCWLSTEALRGSRWARDKGSL